MTTQKKIAYSPQQEALFSWVREGRGNLFLRARAGTGKSTTLVGAVSHMTGSIALAAYNKAAGDELRGKLAAAEIDLTHVRAGTFHSFGWNALRRVYGTAKVDERAKHDEVITEVRLPRQPDVQMPEELHVFVMRLVSLAKQSALGLYGSCDDESQWWKIVDHHDLASDLDDPELARQGIRWAYQALKLSNNLLPRLVNFDDMIYVPAVRPIRMWQNDWVLVDEAQDTNPARRALARKMLQPGGRAVFVGDECQCHPPGTGVWVTGRGYAPIEDVRRGDEVMTYCYGYFPGKKSQGRVVEDVASRPFTGDLVEVSAGGRSHSVTPNHICIARMTDRPGSLVYVMRRGPHARVGRCSSKHGGEFGLSVRCRQEGADEAWVMGMFDPCQEDEASLLELRLAYVYGLPQVRFVGWDECSSFAVKWDMFWSSFPSNLEGMGRCLLDNQMSPILPFWSASQPRHIGKYSFEVYAANLISGWMDVCLFDGNPHLPLWSTVTAERRPYTGQVFSLQVQPNEQGRRLYVADGIVTHNSIFGFTGADDDAVGLIKREFSCAELPLTVTYRCPKAVVAEACALVPDYEAHPSAPEGSVRRIDEHKMIQEEGLQASDAILCRKTAPLVSWAFRLISAGVPCHVEGRDIGAGLLKLANRWKVRTLDALRDRLEKYRDREVEKLMAKGREAQAESLADRVDTLMVLMEGVTSVVELRSKIEGMFQDNAPSLTLCTVHRSKGREWVRVYLLGRYQFMPSPFARQEWQARQEQNLIYVAITRAQQELVYVDTTL